MIIQNGRVLTTEFSSKYAIEDLRNDILEKKMYSLKIYNIQV